MSKSGAGSASQTLQDALILLGVDKTFAEQLQKEPTFTTCSVSEWMSGLEVAARLVNHDTVTVDWLKVPAPWDTVCPAIISSNGTGPDKAILNAILGYSTETQLALITAIGVASQAQTKQRAKTNTKSTSQSKNQTPPPSFMKPIDPTLIRAIRLTLERSKGSKEQKKKLAGELLIEWLINNGEFIRTSYGTRYYLYKATRRLYSFDTQAWYLWLYLLTSVNPATDTFKYFLNDCEIANAELGRQVDVVRVSYWDNEQQILRVSRFDGTVYRLDGMTMEEEANGDGPVVFDDSSAWTPYKPDYSGNGTVIDWSMTDIPNWSEAKDEHSLLYRAWWLATFFTELCPTRPILVMKGEHGSGKSMSLRILLRLMFGLATDVVGVPEKADSFVALTSNSHIVAIDNMDEPVKEIRDKIASLSTGKIDQLRRLYTTNESITIRYRCWLAVTSRTPDTLQRGDLVDRTVILPVKRVEDSERVRESFFLAEVMKKRDLWWGDSLSALNQVVAEIRRSGVPKRAGLRMEDWAALGTVIARGCGQEDIWEKSLNEVKVRQREFLLFDNVVAEAIEAWLSSSQYTSTFLTTRNLYEAAKSALFDVDRPDSSWPRSVKSFGRQLADIRLDLREHLSKSGVRMQWRRQQGNEVYKFE